MVVEDVFDKIAKTLDGRHIAMLENTARRTIEVG